MTEPLRVTFARWCRDIRVDLDIGQQELADAVGVSRSLIASYETGRRIPDLDMVDRIGAAVGVSFTLAGRRPIITGGPRERDLIHARCSGYGHRRLLVEGLDVAREVELIEGRGRGWIDLLAFDPRTGILIVVEIKSSLDDLGGIERQLARYARAAPSIARERGWVVRSTVTWLLVLATVEVDDATKRQRDLLDMAFPVRATGMRRLLAGASDPDIGAGIALIDPARRRRGWLLPTRLDGRRTVAPYLDRADALRRLVDR